MGDLRFPVFVLAIDSGEVLRFETIEAIERELEPIDVENGEYAAWDRDGQPLRLAVQRPTWLCLAVTAPQPATRSLADALMAYGVSVGLQHESLASLGGDPLALHDRIAAEARRARRGLFARWR